MPEIGATLREARLHAKVDITEVERATKIRAKYLRALEDEDWDLLPGPTFVKSFLRTYGDYLGVDSRLLIDEFRRRYERPSEGELATLRPAGRQRAPRGGGGRPPWLSRAVVVALFLALIVALVALGKWKGGGHDTTSSSAAGAHTAPAGTTAHRRRGTPAAAPARRGAQPVRLQIQPTGSVYVCLVDGRGRKLIAGRTLTAGERLPVYRARRFRVTFGNASVRMRIDGRSVPVAPTAHPVGFAIDARGQRPLASAQQPRCL